MSFSDVFSERATIKETENGALAYTTSGGGKLFDFYALVGGMRDRDEKDIIKMFKAARNEDKELADKIVLWARDCRNGGLGERRVGRILMKALAMEDPAKVIRNFSTFINYGRFDDLYVFENTPVEKEMWNHLWLLFTQDIDACNNDEPITLLAKWLKSPNTSSAESRRLAKKFCRINRIPEKYYRKMLAKLRKYTNVVEVQMSANDWDDIDYEKVPSYAMLRYRRAFETHSPANFTQYMDNVKTGTAKINAGVLYPYDLVKSYECCWGYGTKAEEDPVVEEQWKNLPKFFEGEHNIVCCADVSGSMNGTPIAASIGLALYCAERNQGAYHNKYITFTDIPRFIEIDDTESLLSKVTAAMEYCGYNTNFDGMMEEIYRVAVAAQDVPDALLVISDSEIDWFLGGAYEQVYKSSNYEDITQKWTRKFTEAGLPMPKIIFWNVAARQNTFLGKISNPYVNYICGCSAGIMKNIDDIITMSPIESMKKVLEPYEYI